jgi:hypothetical protein
MIIYFNRLYDELAEVLSLQKYDSSWLDEQVLCNEQTQMCKSGTCTECSAGQTFFRRHPQTENIEISSDLNVLQWIADDNGFLIRRRITLTVDDALTSFQDKLPCFILHSLTKRNQAEKYRNQKNEVDSETLLCHFDFAENYTCGSQDQIQSAYYNQKLVSIFTLIMHSKEWQKSVVFCSDNTSHAKETISVYLLELFEVSEKYGIY